MGDREAILGALPKSTRTPLPGVFAAPHSAASNDELWAQFAERFQALSGEMRTMDELRAMLQHPHLLDEPAAALLALPRGGVGIWDAEIGVTVADLAIAETGSLLLSTGPGRPRLLSLSPPINVVLIRKDQIVATLGEAFARLSDRTTVMITGPSRTADIEGVLVKGVHGPGQIMTVVY